MALAKAIQVMKAQPSKVVSNIVKNSIPIRNTNPVSILQTKTPTLLNNPNLGKPTNMASPTVFNENSSPPAFIANIGNAIQNDQGLRNTMLLALANQYGLNANNLLGTNSTQVNNTMQNKNMGNMSDIQNQTRQLAMSMQNLQNQQPMTRFTDSNLYSFFQQTPNSFGNQPMTRFPDTNTFSMNPPYQMVSPVSNQMNPMQQPMQGYQPQPMQNYQQQPIQQSMQGYQQQPMLGQSSYQLQQPQQPPQQSMYPAYGGFGNTMQNQNQSQNFGGLDSAIQNMNKNSSWI